MGEAHHPHLFCFGFGYSARCLARRLRDEGWIVSGTARERSVCDEMSKAGYRAHLFDRSRPLTDVSRVLASVTDILSSIPPDSEGDAVIDLHGGDLEGMGGVRWIGYLSTTGVYGNTDGAAVTESAPLNPTSDRSRRRVSAERAWLRLYERSGLPVHIFRLAGIYGPGRSVFDNIRRGEARRIDKPDHVFSRIHVEDIASVLRASMARPRRGVVYNVCDDQPAAQSEVVAYACELLGMRPPEAISFAEAEKDMSPMARSFWSDNRRVDNSLIKNDLGIEWLYPDYRWGLRAVLEAETERSGQGDEPDGET